MDEIELAKKRQRLFFWGVPVAMAVVYLLLRHVPYVFGEGLRYKISGTFLAFALFGFWCALLLGPYDPSAYKSNEVTRLFRGTFMTAVLISSLLVYLLMGSASIGGSSNPFVSSFSGPGIEATYPQCVVQFRSYRDARRKPDIAGGFCLRSYLIDAQEELLFSKTKKFVAHTKCLVGPEADNLDALPVGHLFSQGDFHPLPGCKYKFKCTVVDGQVEDFEFLDVIGTHPLEEKLLTKNGVSPLPREACIHPGKAGQD